MLHSSRNRLAISALAATFLAACGGGGSGLGPAPPHASYDLQAANAALVKAGLSANVNLSGNVIVKGVASAFTGTGALTLNIGSIGTFHNSNALAQNVTISGTVVAGNQNAAYNSSVVNVFDSNGTSILGETQSTNEVDVATAPILIPASVSSTNTMLGTLNRYSDDTLSTVLGTIDISVEVSVAPAATGDAEVVQFTYKTYDTNKALIETDTFSYNLTQAGVLSFYQATAQNSSGSLTVSPQ